MTHQGCGMKIGKRTCGKSFAGRLILCPTCELAYSKQYPQGWRFYPGDLCKHGVYIGGSGADLMCGRCESGD